MKFKLPLIFIFINSLFSCANKKEKFDYETSIASKVYQSQLKYLDNTLFNYARISKTGHYYFEENNYLDSIADQFKDKLNANFAISESEKSNFYQHFEKAFSANGLIDVDIYNQLKTLPIRSISDIDLLRIYVKNNFVCILLNNKLLPYDSWSTMSSAAKTTINDGEDFEVDLSNTAWNNSQPNLWYLVKENLDSSLTKENILDTLHQDQDGAVHFKTKNYKKGENTLIFISRLNTPVMDYRMVTRKVKFTVR